MQLRIIIVLTILSINAVGQETKWDTWTKKYSSQSNHIPMYGNKTKNSEEMKADEDFTREVLLSGKSKQDVSRQLSSLGWDYLQKNDLETAIMRFNQSWLLDPSNVYALWGFGAFCGMLENPDESIKYLESAYKSDNTLTRLLIDLATAHLIKYNIKKNNDDAKKALVYLLKYLRIDEANEEALYKTAIIYYHLEDYKSSWDYLHKCQDYGGRPIQNGFIDALGQKMKEPK